MARFWVADLHFGHEFVAKERGFTTVEEHDNYLVKQLQQLQRLDEIWILGDIVGREEHTNYALNIINSLSGKKHLIAGNHDSVSAIHRNGFKRQREWLSVFDSVQQFGRIKFNGYQILMNHFPYAYSGDGPGRGPARYMEYRLPDRGFPLLHGYTHQEAPHMTSLKQDLKQFCVSWDAQRRLTTEADIENWTNELRGVGYAYSS